MGRKKRKERVRRPVRESAVRRAERAPANRGPTLPPNATYRDLIPLVGQMTEEQRRAVGEALEENFGPTAHHLLALPASVLAMARPEDLGEVFEILPLFEGVPLPPGGKAEALRDRMREIWARSRGPGG